MKMLKKLMIFAIISVFSFSLTVTVSARVEGYKGGNYTAKAIRLTDEELASVKDVLNARLTSTADLGTPDPDQVIDVIIKLKSASLADKANASDGVANYLKTQNGKLFAKTLEAQQANVKLAIDKANLLYEPTYNYSYKVLLNGFSMSVAYGDIAKIEAIDNVESVIPVIVYDVPKVETTAITTGTDSGYYQIGADKVNAEYDGAGMVIGIVDTGLFTTHEAFDEAYYTSAVQGLIVDEVTAVITNLNAYEASNEVLTADDTYVNNKVVYAYDYADADADVNPDFETIVEDGNSHGTHVAGIAAGYNGADFKGIAPQAQLAIFKVFADGGEGAPTDVIVAALEDAVTIGVDTINMSLGSPSGYSYCEISEEYQAIYDGINTAGISLVCSAGNSYSGSYSGYYGDFGTVSYVDTSSHGSPGSYYNALSVASIETLNSPVRYVLSADDKRIMFNEAAIDSDNNIYGTFVSSFIDLNGEGDFEYVYCGKGTVDDFVAVGDITGKIALVVRGDISFEEKQNNAGNSGAIACIIMNNTTGTISPITGELAVPTISIKQVDGEALIAAEVKTINIDEDNFINVELMSDFSSWGPVGDLNIKPEITAPGGYVYSAYPVAGDETNTYELLSGTSMSSPCASGAVTLVKQYVKDTLGITDPIEANDMVYKLIMSTADVVTDESGIKVASVRKQGAGVINLEDAVNTPIYLQVEGTDRVKLELGDDADRTGVFNTSFEVVNPSDTDYTISFDSITSIVDITTNGISVSEYPLTLNKCAKFEINAVEYGVDDDYVIASGATVTIDVTITLDNDTKEFLDTYYTYGTYVEGYIYIDEENTTFDCLNIPFLGYYGDYSKLPIFDIFSFENGIDGKIYSKTGATLTYLYYNGAPGATPYTLDESLDVFEDYYPAGVTADVMTRDKFAISGFQNNGYTNYGVYQFSFNLLKNSVVFEGYVIDSVTGEILMDLLGTDAYYLRSSYYVPSIGDFNTYSLDLLEVNADGSYSTIFDKYLSEYCNNNMQLSIVLYATTESGGEETFEYPLTIDKEYASIVDYEFIEEEDKTYLNVTTFDNHYAKAVTFLDPNDYSTQFAYPIKGATAAGQMITTKIDVTDYIEDWLANGSFMMTIDDYALNETLYLFTIDETEDEDDGDEPTFVIVDDPIVNKAINENAIGTAISQNKAIAANGTTYDEDFVIDDFGVLIEYKGTDDFVLIPDSVIAIGDTAFTYNTTIKQVEFPDTVKRIGTYAFYGCTNLKYITFNGEDLPRLITEDFDGGFYAAYRNFNNLANDATCVTPSYEGDPFTYILDGMYAGIYSEEEDKADECYNLPYLAMLNIEVLPTTAQMNNLIDNYVVGKAITPSLVNLIQTLKTCYTLLPYDKKFEVTNYAELLKVASEISALIFEEFYDVINNILVNPEDYTAEISEYVHTTYLEFSELQQIEAEYKYQQFCDMEVSIIEDIIDTYIPSPTDITIEDAEIIAEIKAIFEALPVSIQNNVYNRADITNAEYVIVILQYKAEAEAAKADAEAAKADAEAAKADAETAKADAEAAKAAAEAAKDEAETAQAAAEAAKAAAEKAQANANVAYVTAYAAQKAAEDAQAAAEKAQAEAEAAQKAIANAKTEAEAIYAKAEAAQKEAIAAQAAAEASQKAAEAAKATAEAAAAEAAADKAEAQAILVKAEASQKAAEAAKAIAEVKAAEAQNALEDMRTELNKKGCNKNAATVIVSVLTLMACSFVILRKKNTL